MSDLTIFLTALSEKLGTTVEHLWGVLIKQTKVLIVQYIGYQVLLLAIFIIALYFLGWGFDSFHTIANTVYEYSGDKVNDQTASVVVSVFSIIVIIITPFLFWENVISIITLSKNPEYWALETILNDIKK